MLDPEDMNIKKVKSILDNYRCNSFHGNAHPSIDPDTLKILKKSRYYYVYKLMLLDDLVKSVQATKLFNDYLHYTSAARDGLPNAPKYVFYSAHDTNLEVLLNLFVHISDLSEDEQYNIIPFSSTLSLELHKEQEANGSDAFYVKLFFNDEPLKMQKCDHHKCPLHQFHQLLNSHIVPSLEEFCGAKEVIKEIQELNGCSMGSGSELCEL